MKNRPDRRKKQVRFLLDLHKLLEHSESFGNGYLIGHFSYNGSRVYHSVKWKEIFEQQKKKLDKEKKKR